MLRVRMADVEVATVALPAGDDPRARLEYLDETVAPISVSLPPRSRVHVGPGVAAFFRNLLPEGRARERIEAERRVPPGHDEALLAAIGRDCAGALAIVPPGVDEARDPRYAPLDEAQLAALVAPSAADLALPAQDVRISLAGAQSKIALRIDPDGSVSAPVDGAPSSHILKPESPDWPGLATNELLCQRLADAVGVAAAATTLRDVSGTATLVSARYDRVIDPDGGVRRVHQEDACQALGVPPPAKYETFGGPSVAAVARLIDDHGAAPAEDRLALLRLLAFAVVIGNADLHGKNLSFLHVPGGLRLAPAYDLISTVSYPRVSREMAMRIGGAETIDDIELQHVRGLGAALGIRPQRAVRTMRETAASAAARVTDLRQALPEEGADVLVLQRLEELVRGRARHLRDLA